MLIGWMGFSLGALHTRGVAFRRFKLSLTGAGRNQFFVPLRGFVTRTSRPCVALRTGETPVPLLPVKLTMNPLASP